MSTAQKPASSQPAATATDWNDLADRVLAGYTLTTEEALSILRSPDEQLLEVLAAA